MRHKFIVQLQQDSGKKMAGGYRTRLSEKLNGISVGRYHDISGGINGLRNSDLLVQKIYNFKFLRKKLMSNS